MAEEKVEVRDINFRQVLPWTELFRGFQVALDLKKLLLAAAGILAMALGWWLWGVIFYTQARPKWEDNRYYSIVKAPVRLEPGTDESAKEVAEAKQRQEAWNLFKDDRRKWDILHASAGTSIVHTDAGDLATTPEEYEAIKDKINPVARDLDQNQDPKPRTVTLGKNDYTIQAKPYGALRIMPWDQDRGPNPYLLVTGQTGKPWETGHFGEWLVFDEGKVLLEPLVKFLYPVVYMLHPKTGFLNRLYFLLVTLTTLAVWAFFGAAITRMAAVQVARNDKVGMTEALRFTCARYLSFVCAPIGPLGLVFLFVCLLCLFGWFYMIPWVGDIVVAGLFWPLVLLAGLAMAIVLVGLVGWPMMYATISAEGSDTFDAISRSYSYVYQNPWHYLWYSLVALSYGAVVVFFVGFMGSMVVYLGKWGVSQTPGIEAANRDPAFLFVWAPKSFHWRELLLSGSTVGGQSLVVDGEINQAAYNRLTGNDPSLAGKDDPERMTWSNWVGTFLVTVWLYVSFLLVLGFGYSYFWSASTIIYLLMRRKVDDTDLDEVYLEEDETEETYSASTTMPAPAGAPAGAPLQMVESPSLRTPSSPAAAPIHSETAAASTEGMPPGDGAKS